MVDAQRVERLLTNIIDNAAQAMTQPDGAGERRIWFSTAERPKTGSIEICVGNSGSYIEPKDIESLFEAFFTKGKPHGTGLGLAISRKIVSEHGGKIWCQSDRRKGTEFRFTLPACAEVDPLAAKLPADSHHLRTASISGFVGRADPQDAAHGKNPQHREHSVVGSDCCIAVVDDNVFILEAWQQLVKDAIVTTFTSPSAFLAQADADPDWLARLGCIVTDLHFGTEEDGVFLAQEVARRRAVPVLLSSDSLPGAGSPDAAFSARIPKEPLSWVELQATLAAGCHPAPGVSKI
jgi:hypothetical protein